MSGRPSASEIVINVDRVSKEYQLGATRLGIGDFREAAVAAGRRVFRRRSGGEDETDAAELKALDAVSFAVGRGEVVGLIGHNGAGKSTLLRILSRITDPTSGEAWVEGRVGSLLEVGTGFHPELTGRENVFLSGAILGMSRKEIARKFDEIVEFAEMGSFLDTPVKRYSSGMYVRLGFAVAAHLEPEVLIVDEVLAVGDARFQRKCLEKMQGLARAGRTILFVSHNMGSIQALCDRAIVLSGGRLLAEGAPIEAVKAYLQTTVSRSETALADRVNRRGRGGTRVVGAAIVSHGHEQVEGTVIYGESARVRIELSAWLPDLCCILALCDALGRPLCRFSSRALAPDDEIVAGDEGPAFTCDIPEFPLVPGDYHMNVAVVSGRGLEDHVDAALRFQVTDGVLAGRRLTAEHKSAAFAPRHRWTIEHVEHPPCRG